MPTLRRSLACAHHRQTHVYCTLQSSARIIFATERQQRQGHVTERLCLHRGSGKGQAHGHLACQSLAVQQCIRKQAKLQVAFGSTRADLCFQSSRARPNCTSIVQQSQGFAVPLHCLPVASMAVHGGIASRLKALRDLAQLHLAVQRAWKTEARKGHVHPGRDEGLDGLRGALCAAVGGGSGPGRLREPHVRAEAAEKLGEARREVGPLRRQAWPGVVQRAGGQQVLGHGGGEANVQDRVPPARRNKDRLARPLHALDHTQRLCST
mmetsp:Transcript_76314/g.223759  ORF Transcript_76314/g.223759 Transcript_76314/m.223759 type:complete len:266 (+) Transcript_76314:2246-3043(+)